MKLLRVFDIDDTLIVSDAKNKIYDKKNNLKCAITPSQFNEFKQFLSYLQKENIAKISYEEFGDNDEITIDIMENGDFIIRAIYWERDRKKRKTTDDFIDMLKKLKIKYKNKKEISLLEIPTVSVEFRKKIAMFSFIDMGYHNIIFYDDDKKNVSIMKKLEKELKILDPKKYENLKIESMLVPEKDRTKNYEIIEKRTRKKFLDYLYPNGNKCKNFFSIEYKKYKKLIKNN
jgi:hypothetical protein